MKQNRLEHLTDKQLVQNTAMVRCESPEHRYKAFTEQKIRIQTHIEQARIRGEKVC